MMFNFYKKCMALVIMLVGLSSNLKPVPNNNVWAKAELLTAALRAPLVMYNHKLIFSKNESDKKLLTGLGTDLIRSANEAISIYNAYQKRDLANSAEVNGNQVFQYAGLMFAAQDLGSALIKFGNFLNINLNFNGDEDEDDDIEFGSSEKKIVGRKDQKEISELAKKLVLYVFPAAEGIAAVIRAYESHRTQQDENNRLYILNYLCFVTISGCRILSEALTAETGSWTQVLAITKTVICSTLLMTDFIRILAMDVIPQKFTDCKNKIARAEARKAEAEHRANVAQQDKAAADLQRDNAIASANAANSAKTAAEQDARNAYQREADAIISRDQVSVPAARDYDTLGLQRENTASHAATLWYGPNADARKADHDPLVYNEAKALFNVKQIFAHIWNRNGREDYCRYNGTDDIVPFINRVADPAALLGLDQEFQNDGIIDRTNPIALKVEPVLKALIANRAEVMSQAPTD